MRHSSRDSSMRSLSLLVGTLAAVVGAVPLGAPSSLGDAQTVIIAPGVSMPVVNLGTCCGSQPKVSERTAGFPNPQQHGPVRATR